MKKSFLSVSTLVVLISMVAMLACSSVANAKTNSASPKFIYDKKENVEVVYTLDLSGKYLTPKLKYVYERNEAGTVTDKIAYRWNKTENNWMPYYVITFTEDVSNSVLEYAAWNEKSGDFSLNQQKAIYNKGVDNMPVTYLSYNWNSETNDWDLKDQVLFQNYLAIH